MDETLLVFDLTVLSYRYLNMHGEYDFSDRTLPTDAPFDMDLTSTCQPPCKPAEERVGGFSLFV
ncbi:hypothetical protein [Hymenobacter sp. DG01]|uniref:hypothetical protein n=1 Tax=Hymenobacter sp. DG01 TaxID=2584940 RepID=UPI001123B115|nr:hypothetical protein [Hymenobacter sp. DG01]